MLGAAVLLHAGAQPSILPSPWDYLGWGRSLGPIVAPLGHCHGGLEQGSNGVLQGTE